MRSMLRGKRFTSGIRFLILTLILCWSIESGQGQDKTGTSPGTDALKETSLEVRGDVPNSRRIEAIELRGLPRAELHIPDSHDPNKVSVYSGPSLLEVLETCGLQFDPGMPSLRAAMSSSVLVEAADGYRVVFSMAELEPELTDKVIMLADTKDGEPLSPQDGPFRIIVPGDKRPTRWVRQVTAVTVRKE
jgi:hypothetical protein